MGRGADGRWSGGKGDGRRTGGGRAKAQKKLGGRVAGYSGLWSGDILERFLQGLRTDVFRY